MAKGTEGVYSISQVTVKGVYPVAGRRYIVYETMVDSFNNQPAIAIERTSDKVRVKILFVPVGKQIAPQPNHVASHYLADWRDVVSAERPPVDGADEPFLKFAEIPASGRVVIADDRDRELAVMQ